MPLTQYGVAIGTLVRFYRDPVDAFGRWYHGHVEVATPSGVWTKATWPIRAIEQGASGFQMGCPFWSVLVACGSKRTCQKKRVPSPRSTAAAPSCQVPF